jgi:hypothetical protein
MSSAIEIQNQDMPDQYRVAKPERRLPNGRFGGWLYVRAAEFAARILGAEDDRLGGLVLVGRQVHLPAALASGLLAAALDVG